MKRSVRETCIDLCDVCGREDGFQRMNMQKCETCGLSVHETCYGLTNNESGKKYPQWKCAPCSAIGLELQVSKPSEPHRSMFITSRNTECALCCVDNGLHAMHLLYDTYGRDGTPVVLPPNKRKGLKERVAWVHTLCALFIGDREKVVFGCKNNGSYLGESEYKDDGSDDDNITDTNGKRRNSSKGKLEVKNKMNLANLNGEELIVLDNPHHFVVSSVGGDGIEDDWSRAARVLKEARNKCVICGLGNGPRQQTLAIQCCHNQCTKCFHVGCARWGNSSGQYELILFNPGAFNDLTGDYNPATALGYCDMHAKKQHSQNVEFFENDIRQKENQAARRSRTLPHSKILMRMRDKQNGVQINHAEIVMVKGEDEHQSTRWSHLWVPNYKPDSGYFFKWDSVKEITQDELDMW